MAGQADRLALPLPGVGRRGGQLLPALRRAQVPPPRLTLAPTLAPPLTLTLTLTLTLALTLTLTLTLHPHPHPSPSPKQAFATFHTGTEGEHGGGATASLSVDKASAKTEP